MLSRGGSSIDDVSVTAEVRRPPASRSPEAWKPRGGCCCSTAVEGTGSGAGEGETAMSPRATDLRGVVSPSARSRSASVTAKPALFGGISAGGGLGGLMMGNRQNSFPGSSARHSGSVGSEAADADAIVSYGGGPPEKKPPLGTQLSGPPTGIRFHGSQAEAAPGDGGAAVAWDDPFVASRTIDRLLDALAMAGIARLDVHRLLTSRCRRKRTRARIRSHVRRARARAHSDRCTFTRKFARAHTPGPRAHRRVRLALRH